LYFDSLCVGAFAKLRKATVSFVTSVHPSASLSARSKSAPTGRIFIKLDILIIFRKKTAEKIKVLLTLPRGVTGTARMLHALTHSSISRQVREQM
jgi:hypothetical protein